jgi:antagonist of KipI
VLRALVGPHAELVGGHSVLDGLVAEVVEPSNRVGLRLEPRAGRLVRPAAGLRSFGVVTGAVQVPPDGQLIVLGPDHATLGGYPVVACVIGADLGRLGRLGPGDEVVLELLDLAEARRAWSAHRAALRAALGAAALTLEDD